MKPILIVQHEEGTGPGNFEEFLNERRFRFMVARTYDDDPIPPSAEPYSGICALGGSMSAYDQLPWIEPELALMRDADQRGVPIIGHCLGGQLLAKAFGAPVTRSAMKEIGWGEVQVEDAALAVEWTGQQSTLELFQWHGDTFSVPSIGRRFLTSRLCADQAFVIDRSTFTHLGMQFHVEMTPPMIRAWATHPAGATEIEAARQLQNGDGVQAPNEMLRDVERRTDTMRAIAHRMYARWARGLRR